MGTSEGRIPKTTTFSGATGSAVHIPALDEDVAELGTLGLVAGQAPVGLQLSEGIPQVPILIPSGLAAPLAACFEGFFPEPSEGDFPAARMGWIQRPDLAWRFVIIGLSDQLPGQEWLAISTGGMEEIDLLGAQDDQLSG